MVEQQGLLRVPLFHKQTADVAHYALLNGDKHNLCLDCNISNDGDWYRRMAWSSGNNIYLGFGNGLCHIFRFDRPLVESYDQNLVFGNSDQFFKYLSKDNSSIENSIVPYVLRIYRQLRNEIKTENSGIDSLRALLYLLAYSRDGEQLNLTEWGLSAQDADIIRAIESNKWNMIVESFLRGVRFTDKWLQPDVDLILRHTSGKLFEEANYIAYLPSQLTLFPDEKIKYSNGTMQDGAYFTPSFVARSIVEEALRQVNLEGKERLTIFDPACGAGGFLVEALRQLKKKSFNKPVIVIGWDKAATAILMSEFVLNFEKQEWGEQLTINVESHDSLAGDVWPNNVDILLMNPPFLSWDNMNSNMREQVKAVVPEVPKANLAAAFLCKAACAVAGGGILGAVVPTRLLNDQNYEGLRKHLKDSMSLKVIGSLGSYVFENVLAYTSMLVAIKSVDDIGATTVLWTANKPGTAGDGLKALRKFHYTNAVMEGNNYSVYELNNFQDQDSWRIDNYKNINLKQQLNASLYRGLLKRAGELFEIQQGARTGANRVFVVNDGFVMSLPANERVYFRPTADNLSIDMGHLYTINYMFYPRTRGLEPIDSEEKLQLLLPETYRRLLLPARKKLSERPSMQGNPFWWDLTRHRSYLEEKKPKMLSTEFGHSGSFAIDYLGEFVVERGYIWNLNKSLFRQQMKYTEAYLAFFISDYFNTLLEFYGEKLAGAEVYKLGLSYVKNVPLPDLSLPVFEKYIPQLRSFAKMIKEDSYWDTAALNALVNEMMSYVK